MPWLTVREAGESLQLSTRTIQRMIATKMFRSRLDQGRRFICLGDDPEHPAIERPDPALLPHLFDAVEGLAALRVLCYQRLIEERELRYMLDKLDYSGSRAGLAAWEQFYLRIKQCQETVVRQLTESRLDPGVFTSVYLSMMWARIRWIEYNQREDLNEEAPPGKKEKDRVETLLTEVITSLRQLLIGLVTSKNPPHLR